MFTAVYDSHQDELTLKFKIDTEPLSPVSWRPKSNIVVDFVTVRFMNGDLIRVEATGDVAKKDGGRHATQSDSTYLVGRQFSDSPQTMSNLPDWAADLPAAVLAHPAYIAYAARYTDLVLA